MLAFLAKFCEMRLTQSDFAANSSAFPVSLSQPTWPMIKPILFSQSCDVLIQQGCDIIWYVVVTQSSFSTSTVLCKTQRHLNKHSLCKTLRRSTSCHGYNDTLAVGNFVRHCHSDHEHSCCHLILFVPHYFVVIYFLIRRTPQCTFHLTLVPVTLVTMGIWPFMTILWCVCISYMSK